MFALLWYCSWRRVATTRCEMSATSMTIVPVLCRVETGAIMSWMMSLFHLAPLQVHVGERKRRNVENDFMFRARIYDRNSAARSALVFTVCCTRAYLAGVCNIGRSIGGEICGRSNSRSCRCSEVLDEEPDPDLEVDPEPDPHASSGVGSDGGVIYGCEGREDCDGRCPDDVNWSKFRVSRLTMTGVQLLE